MKRRIIKTKVKEIWCIMHYLRKSVKYLFKNLKIKRCSESTCEFTERIASHLLTANIGDSRTIIVYKDNTFSTFIIEAILQDHKLELPEDKKRIELKEDQQCHIIITKMNLKQWL